MKKNLDREQKLQAWFDGALDDSQLTKKDIKDLEKRIFNAISSKTLARDDVHTFAQHNTVQ
jgi:hypothetical protein